MANTMAYGKDVPMINGSKEGPARKRVKLSDLPISSATRAAIEGLAHTFKKKGGYDSLRKQVWDDLEKSDFESDFTQQVLNVAETELDKNPSTLLKLDRGKATLLMEGAIDRAGVYQTAESRIDALIDAHVKEIERGIRTLRREDIGDEAANAEEARGGKTDEQYAEEARKKREARETVRQEARDKEKAIIDEKRREERAKRKEEERRLEAEAEKRRAEREARRKAEREREEEKEKEREKERERDRDRDHERDRDRDRDRRTDRRSDRDHVRDEGRDDRYRRRNEDTSRRGSIKNSKEDTPMLELSKEESERLEQEALKDLLKEGKRTSQRSRHQLDLEVDESLAPPPRKAMPASAIKPISRDSPVKSDAKKILNAPTGPKADLEGFKTPLLPTRTEDGTRDRKRSRSRDRESVRKSSRSRSRRRHDSRDRASRRGSRDRDDRRRYSSRDRDDRHRRDSRDRQRRSDRDRSRSPAPERRRAKWSRSRSREKRERDASRDRREEQAKLWKAQQQEAKDKGLPPPVWVDRTERKEDDRISSPVSARKRELSRDRDRDRTSRARSRSRSPAGRRGSRIERSTSPVNIDRYVPGASSRRRESTTHKRERSRSRDRDRDRDRDSRRTREDDRPRRRSRSRSRSRRRDRSRDRYRDRDRKRSRSPEVKRERTHRSRSREKERQKDRERRRERSRTKERDRKRERSRSRESRRK